MYFAAAVAIHHSEQEGGWHFPWRRGFDFGPYVVDGWQGVASVGGGAVKAKASLLTKPAAK